MLVANEWKDYELIDAGDGEKLERWGMYILRRPDPQAVWTRNPALANEWETTMSVYSRSTTGGGSWSHKKPLPEEWFITYKDLRFVVRPTGFKHTGIFPEQAPNWDFLMTQIAKYKADYSRPLKVLNLFGYTGAATVACIKAGAEVCHLDSSKQILTTARDNLNASGLGDKMVRFIPEDALSFVRKEIRRGKKYDIIIMDPPTFGRGDKGQVWKIEKDLNPLVQACVEILEDKPVAFLINTYVSGIADYALNNILQIELQNRFGGQVEYGELGLPMTYLQNQPTGLVLPAGVYARWYRS
jgi:23S rRNA (cytosine1962-C5)-methyltransferase